MPPQTERCHRQGRETRERILDATIEIAAERGYDGTTMSAIAKRVEMPDRKSTRLNSSHG